MITPKKARYCYMMFQYLLLNTLSNQKSNIQAKKKNASQTEHLANSAVNSHQ